jgi:manganese/zinc/iron transport system permease protein
VDTIFSALFHDYTLRTVALGSATLGLVSGALGSFAMLRQQSLLGDAISHAALPGVAIAFLLTGSKAPLVLVLGAALAGWAGMMAVIAITRTTRIKVDAALGMVLSVFFGFGLMLLTFIQRRPDASQAGLDKFLFGQAATLLTRDVTIIAVLGAAVIVGMVAMWKELKILSFDPEFASSLGYSTRTIEVLLGALLVTSIVIGLQAVGVVLMSALVVAPAAAARQWTDSLRTLVGLAGLFGAVSGVAGALISASGPGIPTGPVIVLVASLIVAVSLSAAPKRGLLWKAIRRWRTGRRLHLDTVLTDLHVLSHQHADTGYGHGADAIEAARRTRRGSLHETLAVLEREGLVREVGTGRWALTDSGRARAEALTSFGDASDLEAFVR